MKKSNRWLWAGLIVLFVALLAMGCHSQGSSGGGDDGGGGDGGGGGGTVEPSVPAQITLFVVNDSVAINQTMTVTATVVDVDGDPVDDGTAITLTAAGGFITITPASQETLEGKATFIITGLSVGIVNLIAQSGPAIETVTINVVDTAPIVTLTVDDNFLLLGTTTTITATVTDSEGVLVPDDSVIRFVVTDSSIAELSDVSAETTDGVATVELTGNAEGTVQVSATYGAGTGEVSVTVAQESVLPPSSMMLTVSSGSVRVGRGVNVTAVVSDATGEPVVDGTNVTFSMNTDEFGSISPKSTVTSNGTGVASTSFVGEKHGEVDITAKAGGVSMSVTISVIADIRYLSLATSQTAINTDNIDFALITATALDENRTPVEGVPIVFGANAGQLSASQVITDVNGEAAVQFSSGAYDKANQTVTVFATAPVNMSTDIPIRLTGTTITLAIINTSLQGQPVPSDTMLTATVKDGGGIGIFGAEVSVVQDSIGPGSVLLNEEGRQGIGICGIPTCDNPVSSIQPVLTDVTGKAYIRVTGNNAGTAGEPITLTVDALGDTASVDVVVSGQAFEILSQSSVTASENFTFVNSNPDTITRPTGSFLVDGFAPGDFISVLQVPPNPVPANEGLYTVQSVLGDTLTLISTDALPAAGAEFAKISSLTSDTIAIPADTDEDVPLWVRSPSGENVRITTSTGVLSVLGTTLAVSGNGTPVLVANPPGAPGTSAIVEFQLECPGTIGVASVHAEDVTNIAVNDSLQVAVLAPSDEGAQISIQASPSVIPVSSGDVTNVSTLLITVLDADDGVVSGAGVTLEMTNKPGGGEYLSRSLVYTDDFGRAEVSLYSGALVTDSVGITITAKLLETPAIFDQVQVVIGGDASSVSIGAPTSFDELSPSVYSKPMSVLVADSNGNPVSGAVVNLSVWPLGYYLGLTDESDGPRFWSCSTLSHWWHPEAGDVYYWPNEDVNKNELVDPGEDVGAYPAHGNGVLDPAKSTAGTVPDSVTTDENGVAEFDYIQQKVYSVWTKVEISATVVVYGTETKAIMQYGPNWLDKDNTNLPNSPWGSESLAPCP